MIGVARRLGAPNGSSGASTGRSTASSGPSIQPLPELRPPAGSFKSARPMWVTWAHGTRTRIRPRAVGFTYSWSRFSTIFVGFFVAFFLRNYGPTGVFVFIASAMIAVFVVIASMGPWTTNLRLEAISR